MAGVRYDPADNARVNIYVVIETNEIDLAAKSVLV